MRLFRRTLLCLVVGVTAFGVLSIVAWSMRQQTHVFIT